MENRLKPRTVVPRDAKPRAVVQRTHVPRKQSAFAMGESARGRRAKNTLKRLSPETKDGALKPPGYGHAANFIDEEDTRLIIMAEGDAFNVMVGREEFVHFSLTLRMGIRLMKWLFWWWVRATWCGLKLRWWGNAMNTLYDEEARAREAARIRQEAHESELLRKERAGEEEGVPRG